MVLDDIFNEAGMTEAEADEVMKFLDDESQGDFHGTASYTKLYEYFCSTGEMPYGVAKARTGDPDVWILDYLTDVISSGNVLDDIADGLAGIDEGPWNIWGKKIWEMT